MKDWIEYGIEEKGKRAYHYHNFKSHYEEYKNTTFRDDAFAPFS
jgi:hypothetical protein